MYTRLVEDTTRKNIIEEVPLFEPSKEGGMWTCPFCNPEASVYKLHVPPCSKAEKLKEVKLLIKQHVELHKKDLLNHLSAKGELQQYEKSKADSAKRVRLWITGTINDRKLYEEDPL